MKRLAFIAGVILLLLAAATACSSGKTPAASTAAPKAASGQTAPTAAPAAAKSAATSPASAAGPAATEAPAATVEAPATEEADLSLADRETGLDKLKSYRMVWQAQWTGTDSDGKAENGSWDWTEEFSSDPKALHWIWKFENPGDTSKNGTMEWWQIADTTYMILNDADQKGECMSFSSADQTQQLQKGIFNPGSLGNISDAKYVGTEDVNGIRSKHYRYDEKALALTAFSKASGEVWVAADGGYVVKDIVKWSGGAGLFGMAAASGDTKGEGQWTWELQDVDKPMDIKAPENCGGAASGIPIMPDATEKGAFGDIVTYKTDGKIADVVAFYEKEMVAAGWEEGEDKMTTDEMATLSFSKDDQKAQVVISVQDGKTQVMVSISK